MNNNMHAESTSEKFAAIIQKWGGIASFLLVLSFIAAPLLYLTGNLRDPFGALGYSIADFLYGSVFAASLVTAFVALRERFGGCASRRMSLALLVAVLAAGTIATVAFLRASNRQYHIIHPDAHLETNATLLIGWTTLIQGVTAAGWHFVGWALMLLGWSGWTTKRLPRGLSLLYLVGGGISLFVYLFPNLEPTASVFGAVWAEWQGIVLLKTK